MDLSERGWRFEDLFKPNLEDEDRQHDKELERGQEETDDRSWETFEADREVRDQGGEWEEREREDRDRGEDFGR